MGAALRSGLPPAGPHERPVSQILFYWRGDNYLHDLDHGVGFHFNQTSSVPIARIVSGRRRHIAAWC